MTKIICMCPECDNYGDDGTCGFDEIEIACGMCEGYSTEKLDAALSDDI